MMTPFTLLTASAHTPASAGTDAETTSPNPSSATAEPRESFLSLMSQMSGKTGESEKNASHLETPAAEPESNTISSSGKAATVSTKPQMATTLKSVMARSTISASQAQKAPSETAETENAVSTEPENETPIARAAKPGFNFPAQALPTTKTQSAKTALELPLEEAKVSTKTAAVEPSSDKAGKPVAAPAAKSSEVDPSVASMMLAMMAQPKLAPEETVKPAPATPVNIKAISDDEESATPHRRDASAMEVAQSKSAHDAELTRTVAPHAPVNSSAIKAMTVKPAEDAGSAPPAVVTPVSNPQPVAVLPTQPAGGTAGATSSQGMKSGAKKNQIAGVSEQKMPMMSAKEAVSSRAAGDLAVGPNPDRSSTKTESASAPIALDWQARPSQWNVELSKATAAAPTVDHAFAMAERIGQLVNQHVVSVRQSDANNVAVSVRLDAQTELNLQLTNQGAQIEATVRWERGSAAGLESHWKDLQESLARQNVQLQPLENRNPSRNHTETGSSSNFDQAQQNGQRQNRGARRDVAQTVTVKTVSSVNKTTNRPVFRQGWESWA